MITIVHGGQTGVDRGGHDAALDNAWGLAGYMPRDGRDELGKVPEAVARFLAPHDKPGLAARTEANVRTVAAVLLVVRDAADPRATPGTAKTLDLAEARRLPRMIADPTTDPTHLARWIWRELLTGNPLFLPLVMPPMPNPCTPKLLVAGPRESKWQGARTETASLLRRVAPALVALETGTRSS